MIVVVASKVIFDADGGKHPGVADEFDQFIAFIGTMKTCGHQDADAFRRDARFEQVFNHWPEKEMVGNGPGDVADENAGAAPSLGKGFEGACSNGVVKSLPDGGARILELRQGILADYRGMGIGGQMHGQVTLAKGNLDGLGIHKAPRSVRWMRLIQFITLGHVFKVGQGRLRVSLISRGKFSAAARRSRFRVKN